MAHKGNTARRPLSRKEARDLDIEIGFIEGVVQRDPLYDDALRVLAEDYTSRGRLPEAVTLDERLVRLRPKDPVAHYNLACTYTLANRFEAAVEQIEQALELGFRDFQWLRRDPDLAKLRKHPLYRRIRQQIKAAKSNAR